MEYLGMPAFEDYPSDRISLYKDSGAWIVRLPSDRATEYVFRTHKSAMKFAFSREVEIYEHEIYSV